MTGQRIACLDVTVWMTTAGFEVEIPTFDGDEFAKTRAGTAAEALKQAGQYVESVLFEIRDQA